MNKIELICQKVENFTGEKVDIKKNNHGFNGVGYEITIAEKKYFLKLINEKGFDNDLSSRRLERMLNNSIPYEHSIPIHAVFAIDDFGIIADIKNLTEAITISEMLPENSKGFIDQIRNKKETPSSINEVSFKIIDALCKIHREKFDGKNLKQMYERSTRSIIHDGELTPGVWDFAKNNGITWMSTKEYVDLAANMMLAREFLGSHPQRLRRIHGDFWAANIFLTPDSKIKIIDSRTVWGDPAIDLAWIIGEYCLQDLIRSNKLAGEFNNLAKLMIERYKRKTKDFSIEKFMALPYSFQAFAEAVFTPGLREKDRVYLLKAANGALKNCIAGNEFDVIELDNYAKNEKY